MSLPDTSSETALQISEQPPESSGAESSTPNSSMQEFYQLQQNLLRMTLLFTGVVFVTVWIFYSINLALNYLIGASVGVVYLRMLARNVEQLGRERQSISKTRLALLVGVVLVASRWDQLEILPIFLGFLTYKAALLFYMLQTTLLPDSD